MKKRDQNKRVIFRRVRGRIIPIKIATNKRTNSLSEGGKYVAGGAAIAAGSGKIYKEVNKFSTRKSMKAFRSLERISNYPKAGGSQLTFFQRQRQFKAFKLAEKASNSATKVGKVARPLRKLGTASAAVFIGYGAAKVTRGFTGEKNELFESAVGTGSAAAVLNARNISENLFQSGQYPKASIKKWGKKALKKIVSKGKL